MTVDAAELPADVSRLLRRQMIVTGLGVAVVLIVVAFTRSQDVPAAAAGRPVDVYLQAHVPPDPGSLHLAYLQLAAVAVAAAAALGHAAHVAAFVFRRSQRKAF